MEEAKPQQHAVQYLSADEKRLYEVSYEYIVNDSISSKPTVQAHQRMRRDVSRWKRHPGTSRQVKAQMPVCTE